MRRRGVQQRWLRVAQKINAARKTYADFRPENIQFEARGDHCCDQPLFWHSNDHWKIKQSATAARCWTCFRDGSPLLWSRGLWGHSWHEHVLPALLWFPTQPRESKRNRAIIHQRGRAPSYAHFTNTTLEHPPFHAVVYLQGLFVLPDAGGKCLGQRVLPLCLGKQTVSGLQLEAMCVAAHTVREEMTSRRQV